MNDPDVGVSFNKTEILYLTGTQGLEPSLGGNISRPTSWNIN